MRDASDPLQVLFVRRGSRMLMRSHCKRSIESISRRQNTRRGKIVLTVAQ